MNRRVVPRELVSIPHQLGTPLITRPTAAFTMTTKTVGNKLHKLAAQWPADPFRPHLQLKTFLESLSRHPNITDEAVAATRSLLQNDLRHKVCRCSPFTGCKLRVLMVMPPFSSSVYSTSLANT